METKIPVKSAKAKIRIGGKYEIRRFNEDDHELCLVYHKDEICLMANIWKNDFGYPGKGKKQIRIRPDNYGLGSKSGYFDKDIIKFKKDSEIFEGKIHFILENTLTGKDPWEVVTHTGKVFSLKEIKIISLIGTELETPFEVKPLEEAPQTEDEICVACEAEEEILPPGDIEEITSEEQLEIEIQNNEALSSPQESSRSTASKHYVIYTDGSSLSNPGPCGAAYIMMINGLPIGERIIPIGNGTNNIAELTAVIEALRDVQSFSPEKVTIITDSQYVVKGATSWYKSWIDNGWISSSGKEVQNIDLWKALLAENALVNADFQWVKGHDGDEMNEKVDLLAKDAAKQSMQREAV